MQIRPRVNGNYKTNNARRLTNHVGVLIERPQGTGAGTNQIG